MRLLRTNPDSVTSALVLDEFQGQEIPRYAILSHTWAEDEVLFINVKNHTAPKMKGYAKVKNAAKRAREDGFQYIWIDTCCIDKSSSAELSEAINSMYVWYENAVICYAYLADVTAKPDGTVDLLEFGRSRWFKRGWCLQELLAPKDLTFASATWLSIGTKEMLCTEIASITGIDEEVLLKRKSLADVSIGKRMYWAAYRQTTRLEDVAYCLMGVFSVNMPMLYGEGKRAFQRLQEEIMKDSDDHSLFAWSDPELPTEQTHGLLADSPKAFARHGSGLKFIEYEERSSYQIGNRGLMIQLRLRSIGNQVYEAALDCPSPYRCDGRFAAIYLRRISTTTSGQQYARICCDNVGATIERGNPQTVFVKQDQGRTDKGSIYPSGYQYYLSIQKIVHETYEEQERVWFKSLPADRFIEVTRSSVKWSRSIEKVPLPFGQHHLFPVFGGCNRISAAILLDRRTTFKQSLFGQNKCDKVVVIIGTTTAYQIGFDALDVPMSRPTCIDIGTRFTPKAPGQSVQLKDCSIVVNCESRFEDERIIYAISVSIHDAANELNTETS